MNEYDVSQADDWDGHPISAKLQADVWGIAWLLARAAAMWDSSGLPVLYATAPPIDVQKATLPVRCRSCAFCECRRCSGSSVRQAAVDRDYILN